MSVRIVSLKLTSIRTNKVTISPKTVSYEALGLCKEGEGHKLVERGDTTYGGKWLVNPSGGLISKGHPCKFLN